MERWNNVYIGNFTGPLDLLLTMIRDKKMSLKDINLLLITDQYVKYIESQKLLDIEIASEFLEIAAQLIEMKSKYLLIKDEPENFEEEIYVDLLDQLSRYEQIKNVAGYLSERQQEYFETFSKQKSNINRNFKVNETENGEKLVEISNLDMEDFANIYRKLIQRIELNHFDISDDLQEEFNVVTTKNLSPQEVTRLILILMKTDRLKVWKLDELIPDEIINNKNLIATFLSILDLVRYQVVLVNQVDDILWIQFTSQARMDDELINNMEAQINEKR